MTRFGIVISTYKRPDGKSKSYVNRALESILNQTHTDYKVYLIGDRYEDNDEFDTFGNNFSEQKFYKQNLEKAMERDVYDNKEILWKYGGCYAFNYGIDLALSDGIEYICTLDHDDYWEKTHLENFNTLIEKHKADWMCSVSTYMSGKLPNRQSTDLFIPFRPSPASLIKSSVCMNLTTIPLRIRNVYEETKKIGRCGDSDLWERCDKYIKENNLASYLVNKLTCYHPEEGYARNNKI